MSDTKPSDSKKNLPKLPKEVKLNFDVPDIKEFLAAGVQFGHQSKRWDPKMKKYIFAKRGDIHIIDLSQTIPLLEDALKFLVQASSKGRVLMVATKRQAAEIVESTAKESGAYYASHRWPGGILTNFKMVSKSFKKLQNLEKQFEEGVEGRTKYEISVMKKDWDRLNRLYRGVKTLDRKPQAIVIVDPNYERNAVREALATGVPIVSIVDTNCDPDGIQYPIPANDDAVKSLKLIVGLIGEAIKQGNGGKGVQHDDKDYSKVEVEIVKQKVESDEDKEVAALETETKKVKINSPAKKSNSSSDDKEGLLGKARKKSTESKSKKSESNQDKEKSVEKMENSKSLSSRIQSILDKENITDAKLKKMSEDEIKNIKGIGAKSAEEILDYLK